LQKNRNAVLGNFSSLARGLIESLYFIYALLLFTNSINQQQILIAIFILLIYAARAVVGDIRDVKPNGEAGKKTFPVTFGVRASKILVILLLLITAAIQIISFNSCLMTMPLLLFALALIFYNNGYVLHQLMILTTSFFHINLISYYTEQNLIFINLIFLGILLNFIFYPLLKRKSNPQFVQE
jgi:4-hydroxybenzoate polyprenyltransferase